MDSYTLHQGEELVVAARRSVELYLISPKFDRKLVEKMLGPFNERHGVMVSFFHYPTDSPRGSHTDLSAKKSVKEKIIGAAVAAGFEDPAHIPLTHSELEHTITQVELISEPTPLPSSKTARLREFKLARHGIMLHYGFKRSVLMPEEAVKNNWTAKRFMEEACTRAGLHPGYWTQPKVKMYSFEVQTFREESPDGKVAETTLEMPARKKGK